MKSILTVVALAIVMPAGIAALGAVLARFMAPEGTGRAVALSVCLGMAVVAGMPGAAGGIPSFPPSDSMGWIPISALAATVVLVALEAIRPRHGAIVWGLAAVLGGGGAFLVGRPTWLTSSTALVVVALGVVALGASAAAASLDAAARRMPVWSVLAALMITAVGASFASLLSSTALFAMLFGGVAAALGALLATGLVFRSLAVPRAGLAIVVLTLAWHLLYVRLYAALPLASLALTGASLFAPYVVARLVPERVRARSLLALAVAAALAGGAVLAAFLASSAPASGASGGDYVG